jgi:hypothetical protein
MLKYLSICFELLAFLIALINLKKNKGSFIQWMAPYLFFVLLTEVLAVYTYYELKIVNAFIYYPYLIINIIFYSYLFNQLLNNKRNAKIVSTIAVTVITIAYLIVFFFIANRIELLYKLKITTGIYLTVFACYYLYTEFANDNLEEFLIKKSGFWIATGVLLFHSGYSIVITLHPFTSKNKIFIFGLPIHNFFAQVLSVFLYTCLAIAMIVWKPKTKK